MDQFQGRPSTTQALSLRQLNGILIATLSTLFSLLVMNHKLLIDVIDTEQTGDICRMQTFYYIEISYGL
jgi:hypothetical protein